jgi:uncharacterized integral membrane protein
VADRPPEKPVSTGSAPPSSPDRTDQTRQLVLGALIVLAVLFALLNLDKVEVDLILDSPKIPLIIVIVGCLALGAAIDRLVIRHRKG